MGVSELINQVKITNDLMTSLDVMYGSGATEENSVSKVVNEQHAKLQVELDDLQKEIDSTTAKITAKETEFVDIKKNSGAVGASATKFFTQQDYFTAMLYIAYIILSMSFYWRMTATEGFSWKFLGMFLIGWAILTTMLFRLFDRFV